MQQYQFIIPNCRDSDKKPHDPEAYNWLAGELLDIAGGFTSETVIGAWRDDSGNIVSDVSKRFTVAIGCRVTETSVFVQRGIDLAILKRIVVDCLTKFDQQCIYFVHPDGTAELVRP